MRIYFLKLFLCAFLVSAPMAVIFSQGFRKTFDALANDFQGVSLLVLEDGYLISGDKVIRTNTAGDTLWTIETPGTLGFWWWDNQNIAQLSDSSFVVVSNNNGTSFVNKFNDNGENIWIKSYQGWGSSIEAAYDGGFVLTNSTKILKINENGDVQWQQSLPFTEVLAVKVIATNDGGFAIAGFVDDTFANLRLIKTDSLGIQLWMKDIQVFAEAENLTILETSDQHIITQGSVHRDTFGISDSIFVAKINEVGEQVWLREFYTNSDQLVNDITVTTNETLLVLVQENNEFGLNTLIQIDENGGEIGRVPIQGGAFPDFLTRFKVLQDGSYIMAGRMDFLGTFPGELVLIKTDAEGYVYSHHIAGHVFQDLITNCQPDANEYGLSGWVITASGAETFYGVTDSAGNFDIRLDTGQYEVTIASYPYWEGCQPSYSIQSYPFADPAIHEMPFQATVSCPNLVVDISTPFIRFCSEGNFVVNLCNQGTAEVLDATVEIMLGDGLQYLGSTNPPISQNGQQLVFEIGDLAINGCGSFQIQYAIGCDNSIIGQTICTEAHAFPDTLCGQPWAGPNLEINGFCVGDSVVFTILNTGGDMPVAQGYIVIEDNLIMMTGEVQLLAGQSVTVAVLAIPTATYHLLAGQDPSLPTFLGYLTSTFSLEGCVGNVTPGAFNQFPQDDGEPGLDIDCHQVVASFDPNDKIGFPTGWTEEHLIDDRTELDYLVRFQNTGTDTAFNVVIIDTLSAFLDPATIRPGASSHSYRFELSGQGVAKFIFNDILLPDSNVNEALSHGFVKFHIAQNPENQPGTAIENTAGIYFDYNAPVYTNTTLHKVREPWIRVINGSEETFAEKMKVSVSPNPMSDWATIEAANLPPGDNTLLLSDAMGREVRRLPFSEGKAQLQRSGLAAGVYFFRVENGGMKLAAGKVVVR